VYTRTNTHTHTHTHIIQMDAEQKTDDVAKKEKMVECVCLHVCTLKHTTHKQPQIIPVDATHKTNEVTKTETQYSTLFPYVYI